MKTFEKICAQGDVMFIKIDELPSGVTPDLSAVEGEELVITHSETGHHHVMDRKKAVMFMADGRGSGDGFVSYLEVKEDTPIVHKRSFDTHAPILFGKGFYEVRRQREYTPEGYRRVED